MDGKGKLMGISIIFASILSLSIMTQSETNLSGFKLNLEVSNFSRVKKSSAKLRGNDKKPLGTESQGRTEKTEQSRERQ